MEDLSRARAHLTFLQVVDLDGAESHPWNKSPANFHDMDVAQVICRALQLSSTLIYRNLLLTHGDFITVQASHGCNVPSYNKV